MRNSLLLLASLSIVACADQVDAGGVVVDAGMEDDPLAVEPTVETGSLDHIQQTIIAKRCSGQPGLCHSGQFEPNLSTAANTYAWLVNRPALERPDRLRVNPGAPEDSMLIDKLRGRAVDTLMPLGADPLSEEDIGLIEDWIRNGALRRPGADPAPLLNNPPATSEIGVFSSLGERLDENGPFTVAVGQTVVLRHSVTDYETSDAEIPFATFILSAGNGLNAVLRPEETNDPHLGVTSYDSNAPMGAVDELNYKFEFTIPATIGLRSDAGGGIEEVASSGLTLTPVSLYVDETVNGMVSISIATATLSVE